MIKSISFIVTPSFHFRKPQHPPYTISSPHQNYKDKISNDRNHVMLKGIIKCSESTTVATSTSSNEESKKWKCMSQCGACCKLDDFDIDVLRDLLKNERDVVEYLDMIGMNGWCKWYDDTSRRCTRYETRPRFCRATPTTFQELYNVDKDKKGEFDTFAISCCQFHIANTYGDDSVEAFRFDDFIYHNNKDHDNDDSKS